MENWCGKTSNVQKKLHNIFSLGEREREMIFKIPTATELYSTFKGRLFSHRYNLITVE